MEATKRRTRDDRRPPTGTMHKAQSMKTIQTARPQTTLLASEYGVTGGPRGSMGYNRMKPGEPARAFDHQDQARANFLSEAITKGVLTARRTAAPFATSESAYRNAPGGRSTIGKVINSQGQTQRNRMEAKVPLSPEKVRQMGYKHRQQEIMQTVQETCRQSTEKSGFYGW